MSEVALKSGMGNLKEMVKEFERQLIEAALAATDGNQRRAAASLGLLPTTLHVHASSPFGYFHESLHEFAEILRSAQDALPPRLRPRVEEACAQLLSLERIPGSSFTYTFFRARAQP